MDTRRQKIIELIREVSKQDIQPEPDESLFESGLLDSFSLQDLVTALEQAFDRKFPEREVTPRKFDTIELIESYLDRRV